jgi:hypothetical protein
LLYVDVIGYAVSWLAVLALGKGRQPWWAAAVAVVLTDLGRVAAVGLLQGSLSAYTAGGAFARWRVENVAGWVPGLMGPALGLLPGLAGGPGLAVACLRCSLLAAAAWGLGVAGG